MIYASYINIRQISILILTELEHVTTPYGLPEDGSAKKKAEEELESYSKGMCQYGYVKIGEQESSFTNKSGWWDLYGVKVKTLSWEIKCNDPPAK